MSSLTTTWLRQILVVFGLGLSSIGSVTLAADSTQAAPSAPLKPKPAVKKSGAEKPPAVKSMIVTPGKRSDFPRGCGCGYFAPTSAREEGPLLIWLNQQGRAFLQVDGIKEELELSSERMIRRRKDTDKLSAGDRILITLKSAKPGNALQASISSSVERNCTIAASQCSAPTFRSQISLSRGDSRKSLSAWSVCSCPGSSKPYTPAKVEKPAPTAAPDLRP